MKKSIMMLSLLVSTATLAADNWLASDKAVLNYLEAVGKVQSIKDVPMAVPKNLPNGGTYYMTVDKDNDKQYTIYFDRTPNCKGVKVCNVGSIVASKFENPQIYYDQNNQPLTQEVTLKDGHKAYFTPGHALGDFWPARIEWRKSIWLLQLSWNSAPGTDEKKILVNLANQIDA